MLGEYDDKPVDMRQLSDHRDLSARGCHQFPKHFAEQTLQHRISRC